MYALTDVATLSECHYSARADSCSSGLHALVVLRLYTNPLQYDEGGGVEIPRCIRAQYYWQQSCERILTRSRRTACLEDRVVVEITTARINVFQNPPGHYLQEPCPGP